MRTASYETINPDMPETWLVELCEAKRKSYNTPIIVETHDLPSLTKEFMT